MYTRLGIEASQVVQMEIVVTRLSLQPTLTNARKVWIWSESRVMVRNGDYTIVICRNR